MDRVRLAFEILGYAVVLCGIIAKSLPDGKVKEVLGNLGTLPIQAIKAALEKKAE